MSIQKFLSKWREKILLAKHGCRSHREYIQKYDPDFNIRATCIRDIYHGYPYIHCFENHWHEVYYRELGRDGAYVIDQWCEQNSRGKYRIDFHRVTKGPSADQWEIDELSGGDYIFIAFKEQQDYIWFMLKWS